MKLDCFCFEIGIFGMIKKKTHKKDIIKIA